MTHKSSYLPGEPSWIDLGTPDLDKTVAFYEALFGWTFGGSAEEFGGYGMFFSDDKQLCGVMPMADAPNAWMTYLSTEDADKTAALVGDNGGVTYAPVMDVGEIGRMAVFADPTGAAFGIWQPKEHKGFQVIDDEGTFAWSELSTRDQQVALPFYKAVFGLEAAVSDGYTELSLPGGPSILGCMDMPEMVPAEVPSYWMPYFASTDPAAQAQQAASLGATVLVSLMEMDQLSFSVVADPHGATFGLLHLKQ